MDNMFPQFSISGESLKRLTIVDPFLKCPDLRIIYQKGYDAGYDTFIHTFPHFFADLCKILPQNT